MAGMRALETIVLTCGRRGKASVQTLHIPYPNPSPSSEGYLTPAGNNRPDHDSSYADSSSDSSCTAPALDGGAGFSPQGRDRVEGTGSNRAQQECGAGVTAFLLRVADAYSRDDSRTVVRRAGAAGVAAGALNLLRALLVDSGELQGYGEEEGRERGGEEEEKKEGEEEEEGKQRREEDEKEKESYFASMDEFCEEQVRSN